MAIIIIIIIFSFIQETRQCDDSFCDPNNKFLFVNTCPPALPPNCRTQLKRSRQKPYPIFLIMSLQCNPLNIAHTQMSQPSMHTYLSSLRSISYLCGPHHIRNPYSYLSINRKNHPCLSWIVIIMPEAIPWKYFIPTTYFFYLHISYIKSA